MWSGVPIGLGPRIIAYLPLDRHVVILGPTRSGKTRLARKILRRARRPAVVLDWAGEYEGLRVDARELRLKVEGMDKKLLSELISLSLNLNEPSLYFLYRSIRDVRIRSLSDVAEAVDRFLATTRSEAEMKAAILRRLEYVVDVLEGGMVPVESLFRTRKVAVVDLSRLRLHEERVLVGAFVLAKAYELTQSARATGEVSRLLVIDEAQNFLDRDLVRHIVFEIAKYGVRALLVSNRLPPQDLLVHSHIIITKPHYAYNINIKGSSMIINSNIERVWII